MAMTGMSAIGFGVLSQVGDPNLSALRVTNNPEQTGGFVVSNPYTGAFLVSARSTTGTGAILTALRNGGPYGAGFYQLMCTGNSASGGFYVSHDGAGWISLTATAMASGAATAIGQWSGYYPYITWVNTWISAGSNLTGTVWVVLDLK